MVRGRGMTEVGKEGDKFKECSKTTEPLFLLKELPRHSAPLGGQQVTLIRTGLAGLGLTTVTKLGSLDARMKTTWT